MTRSAIKGKTDPSPRSMDLKEDKDQRRSGGRSRTSEERLKASERKYRALVESIPDIIFSLAPDGSFHYIGPRWKKILDHEDQEVLGKYFIDFAPPEEHRYLIQVFKEVRDHRQSVENIPLRLRHRDGTYRYFSGSAAPLRDGRGRVIGTIGIARDITEQKKLEEQLLQAQKMESIGNLAGGIAHDFNNLLSGILGYASFVKKKMSPRNPLYHSIQNIQRSAEQAADLVKQLLGFARKGKYEVKPVNINTLVQEVARFLKRTLDKRIRLVLDLDPHLKLVEGDETQLQQSLINICLNARDAMPDGGTLSIRTQNHSLGGSSSEKENGARGGEWVKITLSDTGLGMSPEVRSKIFEPFFTTKEAGRGTGLGLSMVYGIIHNHGGTIEVESQPGKGSSFTLILPALPEAKPRPSTDEPKETLAEGGHETVLIVDDEEMIRQLGADILEDAGYTVLTASRGEEGLDLYRSFPGRIDLVLLDVIMPGMGGKETFRALRGLNPALKILLSSGYSTDGGVEEILKEGAVGFIQKPYRDEVLLKKVREVLDA
jgi:two-component system cell cycle sensor histidine kinase/response regulator CckA